MKLSGWGRYPVVDCRMKRLREREALPGLLGRGGALIARGNGRSYGDAALNPDLTLSMLAMDRMQAFDAENGLLTCESGVLLADVLDTFLPRGWLPPVVPGTKFVTVGGMAAADVHGKNHHRDGSFGAHVESLTLATADGETRTCSRAEHADLFRATVGGMGLTGVILSVSFRLEPSGIPSFPIPNNYRNLLIRGHSATFWTDNYSCGCVTESRNRSVQAGCPCESPLFQARK